MKLRWHEQRLMSMGDAGYWRFLIDMIPVVPDTTDEHEHTQPLPFFRSLSAELVADQDWYHSSKIVVKHIGDGVLVLLLISPLQD